MPRSLRECACRAHSDADRSDRTCFPLGRVTECWCNAIVLLRSDNAGRTFARVGDRPVASIPIRQEVDQGHNRGFFEPSNIVKRGDFYFALIHTEPEGAQAAGTCLFRTDEPVAAGGVAVTTARDFRQTSIPTGTT